MSKLKRILERKGMKQIELAKKTGLNYNYLNRYIGGYHDISLTKAKIIADALKVKIDDFA